ncbi:hypothetical protein ALO75_04148 [Pseudomonas syringae pv. coryli]|uniref:ABC transmembrane type-1 domain-containing protein n=1 Tax=Pseudomonas syringae pv. coryli TaxID=317659 RepID=A0A0P9P118_9PSED|nr:hypothetical protein ALO75_04148 [Pseudomonas syringae pv. coryli]
MGLLAGYFGGKTDAFISYLITCRLAMPVRHGCAGLGFLSRRFAKCGDHTAGVLLWDRVAVVTRAAVIQIRHAEFVAAAQSMGCSTLRILVSEILFNLGGALIVVATLEMAHAILLEAALSFLGGELSSICIGDFFDLLTCRFGDSVIAIS